jgi:glycosyltransferase involved in cell wall biosynthesis
MTEPAIQRIVGCTVIAGVSLPAAVVLARSYLEHHPDHGFVIVVIDDESGSRVDVPGCRVRGSRWLDVDRAEFLRMATAYTADELTDAVRPLALRGLLVEYEAVIHLAADTRVFAPFPEIAELADTNDIALVPHLVAPWPADGMEPGHDLAQPQGTFDSGFIAVGRGAKPFLDFWAERAALGSATPSRGAPGLNQATIDSVPALFGHAVIRDPGFAVAYWNLHEREISDHDGAVMVGAKPVRFIRFHGYRPETPWLLTSHCPQRPRTRLSDQPDLRAVCDDYREALVAAGYRETKRGTYGFGSLGAASITKAPIAKTSITKTMRELFLHEWTRFVRRELAPSPFDTIAPELPPHAFDGADTFREWLRSPGTAAQRSAGLNRLTAWIWEQRGDLQAAFPQPYLGSAEGFRHWCRVHGRLEGVVPEWAMPGEPVPPAAPSDEFGVNVAGYLTAELGLGEMGRIVLRAVEAADVPVVSVVEEASLNGNVRTGLDHPDSVGRPRFPVSILAVNADYTQILLNNHPEVGHERYVIGLWAWELEDFPPPLHTAFALVDEVWTISDFCRTAIAKHSSTPVHVIPVPIIDPGPAPRAARAPGDPVRFLFAFDFNSTGERKNPWGVVTAFQRAFPDRTDVRLVIKATNGHLHASAVERLRHVIGTDDRIELLQRYLRVDELDSLYADSHAYVSLHRSEGFGLTVAEAMVRGMAVISTDYAGTAEFLDESVGWPIPYRMVEVGPGWLPYHEDGVWADPDLDAAAEAMRRIADDPAEAKRRGDAAREHILLTRSMPAAAQWMRDRLSAAHQAWRTGAHRAVKHVDSDENSALDRAAQALHWAPDIAAPSRLPLAPAMRKIMLRVTAHYDAHQRKVVGAVLDGVRDAVRHLGNRLDRTAAQQAGRLADIESETSELTARIERIERAVERNDDP